MIKKSKNYDTKQADQIQGVRQINEKPKYKINN